MDDKQIKLIIGSLLHDIGKVAYRSGDGRAHSQSGYEFLKEQSLNLDAEVLNCVRYHHGANLRKASIPTDACAYLTYFADNVASAMDRREAMDAEDGFDKTVPLASVFNLLNNNNGKAHYAHHVLNPEADIPYPTEAPVDMDESFYAEVLDRIRDNLKGVEVSEEYINSLLSILEANLSYVPSSTSRRELADISLYDHVKLTAAIAECLYQYCKEKDNTDYRKTFFSDAAKKMWDEKTFLLYSMDLSGIQKFIYTISSAGALRGLRARSFYLEILMEHIIDELLMRLQLSRSCLIYSGGGHCYLLLPNTDYARETIRRHREECNQWFMEHYGIALYIAGGAAACSAHELMNQPDGSYSELFRTVSRAISQEKSHRYRAEEIRALNSVRMSGKRECKVCRKTDTDLDEEGRCRICSALHHLSGDILYQDYFIVMTEPEGDSLPLPGERYLTAGDDRKLLRCMDKDTYVRSYTKNQPCTGKRVATKLWVGNYHTGDTFEELAEKAEGIERIAVLRGDVDNLGTTFVSGFHRDREGGQYETLSRTASLSRQLSLFFKLYLNKLLQEGESGRLSKGGARQLCIVYSGGDDVFLVGAWNDVMDAALDLRNAFECYTEGTLTISCGIGLYSHSYPINRMAAETAELEDYSKKLPDKNGITIFDREGRYDWNEYSSAVLAEKYKAVFDYMSATSQRGKAFLYHLLELLREAEGPVEPVGSGQMRKPRFNRARFVYFLSRMEPQEVREGTEEWTAYREFSGKMYQWSMDPENRRQLISAIYLYVYITREREGDATE